MSRSRRMNPAILLTLGSLLALGPSAMAQTTPQSQGTPTASANVPDDESAEGADRFPIFAITSVEILRSKLKPEINVVAVHGLTSARAGATANWCRCNTARRRMACWTWSS